MKVGAVIPVFNESRRIGGVLERFTPGLVDTVVLIDDGSTDTTPEIAKRFAVTVVRHPSRLGVGAAIRDGLRELRSRKIDIAVVLAGNGKDDPSEIGKLVRPIFSGDADYVQGSRFFEGGQFQNLPWTRYCLVKLYTLLWSLLLGRRLTDVTNGFRAYKLDLLADPRVRMDQDWLDAYDFEYYLQFKALTLGWRFVEVPVSKNYPSRKNYSKIRPILDWWSIIRPLLYLRLGLKS